MSEAFINDGDVAEAPDAFETELNELKNSLGLGDSKSVEDAPDDTYGQSYDRETERQKLLGYQKITDTLRSGDIQGFLEQVDAWNPIAAAQLRAHLHRNGSPQSVQELNHALVQQLQGISQAQEAKSLDTATRGYLGQVDKLSHAMDLTPEESQQVFETVNAKVASNSHLKTEIKRGNVKAINTMFKEAVAELRLGPPVDINKLTGSKEERAEQRDQWLEQQLHALKKSRGK
jgi:hypothetical protein